MERHAQANTDLKVRPTLPVPRHPCLIVCLPILHWVMHAQQGPGLCPCRQMEEIICVPAIPDVPQAAEDILKSIALEIEKLISEKLAGTTPGGSNKPSNFKEERNNTWIETSATRKARS